MSCVCVRVYVCRLYAEGRFVSGVLAFYSIGFYRGRVSFFMVIGFCYDSEETGFWAEPSGLNYMTTPIWVSSWITWGVLISEASCLFFHCYAMGIQVRAKVYVVKVLCEDYLI